MNARTQTEKLTNVAKQDYRRYQYGGSFGRTDRAEQGALLRRRRAHAAGYEAGGHHARLLPNQDGVFPTPSRETLFTGKVSANLNASHYLSVRYGRNTNSQVYGAATRSVQDNWGDSKNKFNSINVNHNWVLPGAKLNEFVFQYADFDNHVAARTGDPRQVFPNGVVIGYNANTPQSTIQHKFQFRDDFSWRVTGMGGLGHDFKAGVNYIHEPKLFVTFASGSTDYAYTHLTTT